MQDRIESLCQVRLSPRVLLTVHSKHTIERLCSVTNISVSRQSWRVKILHHFFFPPRWPPFLRKRALITSMNPSRVAEARSLLTKQACSPTTTKVTVTQCALSDSRPPVREVRRSRDVDVLQNQYGRGGTLFPETIGVVAELRLFHDPLPFTLNVTCSHTR